MRRLPECRVVVITLGLAEVWRDLTSGLPLNLMPIDAIAPEPDRFVLDVLSYQEIVEELEEIHALLSARGHPDFRILITVSPVPLKSTFRAEDVITANSYSKSVQRAAVEAFVLAHENVDYFPSYETVSMTDRRLAFEIDNRHVQSAVVARVIDRAIAAYSPELAFEASSAELIESGPNSLRPVDLLRAAEIEMQQGAYDRAAHCLASYLDRYGDRTKYIATGELRLKYATCLGKAGMGQAAMVQTYLAAKAADASPRVLLACADRLAASDPAAARQITDEALVRGADELPDALRNEARELLLALTPAAAE
jgi:hypothetical protein